MRTRRQVTVLAAVATAAALAASPASAAVDVVAWEMNEKTGRVMTDSVGSADGSIGTDVVLTGGTYRFPFIKPGSAYRPEHIITVPDGPTLDPGSTPWSITTRFMFTNSFGNMMQKGQGGAGNTYFKMQAPRGVVSCLFRGASGSVSVNSGTPLNDGAWHTVTCRRDGSDVTMTIDGTKVRRASGATGAITNNFPFTIGGKSKCAGSTVSCDYWVGQMDYVRIARG